MCKCSEPKRFSQMIYVADKDRFIFSIDGELVPELEASKTDIEGQWALKTQYNTSLWVMEDNLDQTVYNLFKMYKLGQSSVQSKSGTVKMQVDDRGDFVRPLTLVTMPPSLEL